MTIKKIIRMIAAANGLSMIKLSKKMGRADTYMTATLNNHKGFGINLCMEILEALNCELVVRDKTSGIEVVVTRTDETK